MQKTIEERAREVIAEIGRYSESSEIRALIEKALRKLAEDCAKIADANGNETSTWDAKHMADGIAEEIRALAAEARCQHKFTEPEPPPNSGEPCALGHDNPNLRDPDAALGSVE